jgi:glutamyl-tRNA reductase
LEPTFVVVGLNHRTAPVEVRERFWMSGSRQAEALRALSPGEGIEEVLVFSTCNRTELVVWGDPTLAVNSILRFLTAQYDLKLSEWNNFYRLLDDEALAHAFRVSCGLDSMRIGEEQIGRQVRSAWQQARNAGTSGRFLDAILRRALAVRRRVRKETAFGSDCTCAACAAVAVAEQIFGSVAERNIVLLGAGNMAEKACKALVSRGAEAIAVVDRTDQVAEDLAQKFGVRACRFEDRWRPLAEADLVISATAAAGYVVTAGDMIPLARDRKGRRLVFIDLAVPRDIDPAARELDGVLLYDFGDLERSVAPRSEARVGASEAEAIVLAEVREHGKDLIANRSLPELIALRMRLDEICRQELESFRLELGPFPKDQDQLIAALGARITHKIAGSLAKELKLGSETKGSKRLTVSAGCGESQSVTSAAECR